MKRTLIALSLAAIAAMGGSASAQTAGVAEVRTDAGENISETQYALTGAGLIAGLDGEAVTAGGYSCTIVGEGQLAAPGIGEELTWALSCTSSTESRTFAAALTGTYRPTAGGVTSLSGLGGFNGAADSVLTCKGEFSAPRFVGACAILS